MAETEVTMPDGKTIVFPEGMGMDEINAALKSIASPTPTARDALALPLMHGLQRQPTPGPTIGDAARGVISGMGQDLSATLQGTTPTVRDLTGKMNYGPALGEAGPLDSGGIGWIDAGGMHRMDPGAHVILNDPDSGKPMVYPRSQETGQGGWWDIPQGLGRLLGFGSIASSNIGLRAPARSAVDMLTDRLGGPEVKAQREIGAALRSDVAAGGPGPADIAERMTAAPTDVLPVDVAGRNIRRLAGTAYRTDGPGAEQMATTLEARDAQAGKVLTNATDTMATGQPGQSTFMAGKALEQQARADATPLYGRAYMHDALNPDLLAPDGELTQLLKTPSMKDAARNALKIAAEARIDPATLGIGFNEAGDVAFQRVPSWQTLDYLKRGMDDVVKGARDQFGKLDTYGNQANQTRIDLVNLLDRENPHYAPARAAWGGPTHSKDVLEEGERIFSKHPDEIAYDLAQMSPTDQQFYRLGAANKLKERIGDTSSGGDEARKLLGNQNLQDRIAAVFPNAAKPGDLLDVARGEKLKFQTMRDITGGSQTGERVAADASKSPGLVSGALDAALAYGTGGLAGRSIYDTAKAWLTGGKMSPQVAEQIVGQLLQNDPALARAWMMQAFERGRSAAGKPVF
jgi:hypothetical protein